MKVHAPNACPSCGKRISAMQLLLGTEKFAIKCAGCGERLLKRTRALAVATGGTTILIGIARSRGYLSTEFVVMFLVILALVAFIASVTVSVRVAGPDVPDPPPPDPRGEVRDGPPPLSKTFRGMSSPPPKQD